MNDEQLSQFLDQGYLVLMPDDVPDTLHDQLFSQAAEAYVSRRNAKDRPSGIEFIGDNIVTQMPALNSILGAGNIHQALTDIVGEDYFRYGHSFIHESSSYDQGFHKDSHLPWSLRGALRSHRPNWAMAFYYPQDTTISMGATRILPGSQYWNVDHEIDGHTVGEDRLDYQEKALYATMTLAERDQRLAETVSRFDPHLQPLSVEVRKGSIAIVHFDIIHRGARNETDSGRYMFKFWFARTTEPRTDRQIVPPGNTDPRRVPIIEALGHWFGGSRSPQATATAFDAPTNEGERIARAYLMGMHRDPALLEELQSEIESTRRAATYGLTAFGEGAIQTALAALESRHMGIRASAAFLLGELAICRTDVLDKLVTVLASTDADEVRSTALVAMTRIARRAIAEGSTEFLQPLINAISACTDPSRERDYPDTLYPMNPIRQYAALALLSIVSESIRAGQDAATLGICMACASAIADQETDRYARGAAVEILYRIRRADVSVS